MELKHGLILTGLLALAMQGCTPLKGEIVLAVALDSRSSSYSIVAIPAGGHGGRDLFRGTLRRSYSGIAIRSLSEGMTLRVREWNGSKFRESLLDFNPTDNVFSPSCRADGPPGDIGVFSPNGKIYARARSAGGRAAVTLITCGLGQPTMVSELVDPAEKAPRAWYTSLSWSPSGRKIVATRLWQDGRSFHSELRLLTLTGGVATVLPKAEGPIASAFASEDEIVALARDGIVTVDLRTGQMRTMLPRTGLDGRRYIGGGIAWVPKSHSVAIGLFNPTTNSGEIWKIHAGVQATEILYKRKNNRFYNTLCIESP